jgi:hypothetical protein
LGTLWTGNPALNGVTNTVPDAVRNDVADGIAVAQ